MHDRLVQVRRALGTAPLVRGGKPSPLVRLEASLVDQVARLARLLRIHLWEG
ncbi:MAG TPA: hypothetical protein VNI83_04080 [Vicinamibacterales bacterium]|nr:hypothetical protein [Vicinamibacterales bacterium]